MDTTKLIKFTRSLAQVAFVLLRHAAGLAGMILVQVLKALAETKPQQESRFDIMPMVATENGIEPGSPEEHLRVDRLC